jgi:hypothetical protein
MKTRIAGVVCLVGFDRGSWTELLGADGWRSRAGGPLSGHDGYGEVCLRTGYAGGAVEFRGHPGDEYGGCVRRRAAASGGYAEHGERRQSIDGSVLHRRGGAGRHHRDSHPFAGSAQPSGCGRAGAGIWRAQPHRIHGDAESTAAGKNLVLPDRSRPTTWPRSRRTIRVIR